jgi:hypothetical protein
MSGRLIIWLAIPVTIAGVLSGGWLTLRSITSRQRTLWKTGALIRLTALSITNEVINEELKSLKASQGGTNQMEWTGEHVLVMTNGDYIIYEYRHGRNDHFPPHLFLGHCSDGRWLYSSYHFCNGMAMVCPEDPPGSITEFAKRYSAREFDGKSDECLKETN